MVSDAVYGVRKSFLFSRFVALLTRPVEAGLVGVRKYRLFPSLLGSS